MSKNGVGYFIKYNIRVQHSIKERIMKKKTFFHNRLERERKLIYSLSFFKRVIKICNKIDLLKIRNSHTLLLKNLIENCL